MATTAPPSVEVVALELIWTGEDQIPAMTRDRLDNLVGRVVRRVGVRGIRVLLQGRIILFVHVLVSVFNINELHST